MKTERNIYSTFKNSGYNTFKFLCCQVQNLKEVAKKTEKIDVELDVS